MRRLLNTLLVLLLIQTYGFSQNTKAKLNFETKYYDAVNKWIAFPKQTQDSIFAYGFIYIDQTAGFTFQLEDFFTVKKDNLIALSKVDKQSTIIKNRLEFNTSNVHILTKKQRKNLKLPNEPEWLSVYKKAEDDLEYLKQLGYHYNHIGACKNALKPLLKAYTINPHYDGLEFEIAYAHNVLKQHKLAIPILEKAIKNNSNNHFFYKELGYAYANLKDAKSAEKVYINGIKISKDDAIKCEMAVNMSQLFFKLKNKKKFKKWAAITRSYGKNTPQYIKYIDYFEKELEKN